MILFYAAGSKNGLEGVGSGGRGLTKGSCMQETIHFFVIGKCVEDVRQGQKICPDLLEMIMKATDPAKEELWRKTGKMYQFRI